MLYIFELIVILCPDISFLISFNILVSLHCLFCFFFLQTYLTHRLSHLSLFPSGFCLLPPLVSPVSDLPSYLIPPSFPSFQWLWAVTSPWRESDLNGKVTTRWQRASCTAKEMSSGIRRQHLRAGRRSGMRCELRPVPLRVMTTYWLRPSLTEPASRYHMVRYITNTDILWPLGY